MNKREMIMNEIRAILQPKDEYFIQDNSNGLFYRDSDYDLSIGQPLQGAKGRALNKDGQCFNLEHYKIYF